MEIKSVIIKYISTGISEHRNSIKDDEMLIELGIIDSLGILKLISFIEEKFGIEILDEELIPENFQTINDICCLIKAKQKTRQELRQ